MGLTCCVNLFLFHFTWTWLGFGLAFLVDKVCPLDITSCNIIGSSMLSCFFVLTLFLMHFGYYYLQVSFVLSYIFLTFAQLVIGHCFMLSCLIYACISDSRSPYPICLLYFLQVCFIISYVMTDDILFSFFDF